MIALTIAATALAVCGLTAVALMLHRRSWLRQVRCDEVVVTTTGGDSFRGVLDRAEPEGIVLDAAVLVAVDEQLAGRVWIPRHTIRWVQKP